MSAATSNRYQRVLEPLRVKDVTLRNRIVYPPIGTGYATREGYVTGGLINYHAARAVHVGMDTVEFTTVRQRGALIPNHLAAYDDKFVPGLAKLAEAIKSKGATAALQLVDLGARTGTAGAVGDPLAPSKIPAGAIGLYESIEMTVVQIKEMVEAFAEGARRAYQAGFDVVEIHAAHMYLISQFLSGFTNKRTDDYGGYLENRARFLLQIITAVKQRVPDNYPVAVRINGEESYENGLTIDQSQRIAQLLEKAGVDIISVSRIIRKAQMKSGAGLAYEWNTSVPPKEAEDGCNLYLAEAVRKVVKVPVMTAGKIFSLDQAEQILRDGKADLIGMARQLIADPDTIQKELGGRSNEVRRCKQDHLCGITLGSGKPVRCSWNKALPPENISTPA
ncbi:MAG: NADH:flavin oxidoreductase [Chloroflexi bacterium]|nr:NADH:flavin oxidoreductase [Chloroflexota bacterium]